MQVLPPADVGCDLALYSGRKLVLYSTAVIMKWNLHEAARNVRRKIRDVQEQPEITIMFVNRKSKLERSFNVGSNQNRFLFVSV